MNSPHIDRLDVDTYTVPTPGPEADGTLQWDATTAVVVHAHAGGATGLGWTYSSRAAAAVVAHDLRDVMVGRETADITGAFEAMHRACRNYGTRGLVTQAISAVDIALWDLDAQLRNLPLSTVLGRCRTAVPIYGSGGFTNLDDDQLAEQVNQWCAAGCTAMKIKIGQDWGSDIDRDLARVNTLRQLAGEAGELMVDANGAYTPAQARRVGAALDRLGVTWFEEPVSSDDTEGLAACATPCAATSPPANTSPTATTPAAWRRSWTACNSTPPDAADTAAGWPPHPSPPHTTSTSPRTAHPHCTCPSRPPSHTFATSNTSSTTPASKRNCSTASPPRWAGS